MKIFSRNLAFPILTIIVLIVGIEFWFSDLSLDPPIYFGETGQSLSTDPAHCIYHARNRVLFGDTDPFDYSHWIVLEKSLVSLTAGLWFSIAGVSYEKSNFVGVLLSLGALLFFLLAMLRHHRPWTCFFVALCYLLNSVLMVHGRLPYLENGLLFVASLMFMAYSFWGTRAWSPIVSGVLIAIAMLMGKFYGVVLLPAILLTEWFSGDENRKKRVLSVLVTFLVSAVALFFAIYRADPSSALQYYTEGSYGLRGFPEGLSSPWGFFEHFVSYGFSTRLFLLNSDLLAFLLLGGLLWTHFSIGRGQLSKLSPIVRLCLFTVACTYMSLMPLNYSPIRYSILFIPPLIMFSVGFIDYALTNRLPQPNRTSYARFSLLFLLMWMVSFQIMGTGLFLDNNTVRLMTWSTLPAALILTYVVRYLIIKYKYVPGRKTIIGGIVVVLAISVTVNGQHLSVRDALNRSKSIKQASADIGEILGKDAVLSGPYGPALTVDNKLKSFIYYFGVTNVDSTLFERYPITHLALDSSNWLEAVNNYPALSDMQSLTTYWIRNFGVKITNISKKFGNAKAAKYQPTGYERAFSYYKKGKLDSAFASIQKFLSKKPRNRSGNILLADIYTKSNYFSEASTVLKKLANRYPNDYYTNLLCGRSLQIAGLAEEDNATIALARKYYEKAIRNNPLRANFARSLYDMTQQQFMSSQTGGM